MTLTLNKNTYNLLKKIDWFELNGQISLNDEQMTVNIPERVLFPFESGEEEMDGIEALGIVINENIVVYGMENQDTYTEYGKDLSMLYDWLMSLDY